jgi:hypothetical protein
LAGLRREQLAAQKLVLPEMSMPGIVLDMILDIVAVIS